MAGFCSTSAARLRHRRHRPKQLPQLALVTSPNRILTLIVYAIVGGSVAVVIVVVVVVVVSVVDYRANTVAGSSALYSL